ncbi:3262_t:CDS:2, partial [Racocetra fulgida]
TSSKYKIIKFINIFKANIHYYLQNKEKPSTSSLNTKSLNNCYDNSSSSQLAKSSIKYDNDENNDYENSVNLNDDIVVSEEEEDQSVQEEESQNEDADTESDFAGDNIKVIISDPVQELFI